jgi:hypothetical protein
MQAVSSSTFPLWAIIAIAIGAGVLILASIIAIVALLRRNNNNNNNDDSNTTGTSNPIFCTHPMQVLFNNFFFVFFVAMTTANQPLDPTHEYAQISAVQPNDHVIFYLSSSSSLTTTL